MDQWTTIRYLAFTENLSQRAIAKKLKINRKTVVRALCSENKNEYHREPKRSKVAKYEQLIRNILSEFPMMVCPEIADRVGWEGARESSTFRLFVSKIRHEYFVPDPVDKLHFDPGEQIQCDLTFFETGIIPGILFKIPVLTMISCYSGKFEALMLPSRTCGDILAGMNTLLERFGGLPKNLLWDNESGLVHNRALIPQSLEWEDTLGIIIKLAKPYDPETKGRIERLHSYLKKSYFPGRKFLSIEDFNAQINEWNQRVAENCVRRSTGDTRKKLFVEELSCMRQLPSSMPKAGTGGNKAFAALLLCENWFQRLFS